jgi:hypothetical protein
VERVDRPCAEPAACGGGQGDQPAGLDVAEDRLEPARESSVTGGGLTSARFGITASVAPVRLWSHEGPDALLRGRAERRFDDLSRRAPSPQAHREPLADGPAAAPGRLPAALSTLTARSSGARHSSIPALSGARPPVIY